MPRVMTPLSYRRRCGNVGPSAVARLQPDLLRGPDLFHGQLEQRAELPPELPRPARSSVRARTMSGVPCLPTSHINSFGPP